MHVHLAGYMNKVQPKLINCGGLCTSNRTLAMIMDFTRNVWHVRSSLGMHLCQRFVFISNTLSLLLFSAQSVYHHAKVIYASLLI